MAITVVVADGNESIRLAIRRAVQKEPRIELVGEAPNFAKAMQMIADFKPEVMLMDLHLGENRGFTPKFVKSQLVGVRTIVALSFVRDDEAQILARTYGAYALLDKMSLVQDLVPTILQSSEIPTASNTAASAS